MNINKKYILYDKAVDVKRLMFIYNSIKQENMTRAKVLDVGCGNGIISMFLGSLSFDVLGIDVSKSAIEKAIMNNDLPNVSFKVLNAEELIVSGEKYDIIICSEVLEHLFKPEHLLKVLHELLSDKGILIVTVPNGRGPRELLVTRPYQKIRKQNGAVAIGIDKLKKWMGYTGTTTQSDAEDLEHIQFFSLKDLKKLSINNQYKIVKIGKTNFIEDVFPFSFFSKRFKVLQEIDCKLADLLPLNVSGGFNTIWKKA